MRVKALLFGLMATLAAGVISSAAVAQDALESIGKPVPGGMGFQPAATELARDIQWLDNFLLVIITVLMIMVVLIPFLIKSYREQIAERT